MSLSYHIKTVVVGSNWNPEIVKALWFRQSSAELLRTYEELGKHGVRAARSEAGH